MQSSLENYKEGQKNIFESFSYNQIVAYFNLRKNIDEIPQIEQALNLIFLNMSDE